MSLNEKSIAEWIAELHGKEPMVLTKTTPLGHWTVTLTSNVPEPTVSVKDVLTEMHAACALLEEAHKYMQDVMLRVLPTSSPAQ